MPELEISQWLDPIDVDTDPFRCVFADEGDYKDMNLKDGSTKSVFEISIDLPNHETKSWTMNKTSQKAVATAYGKDTALWVGKEVELFKVDQMVGKEMRKVIYARIPQKRSTAKQDAVKSLKKTGTKVKSRGKMGA